MGAVLLFQDDGLHETIAQHLEMIGMLLQEMMQYPVRGFLFSVVVLTFTGISQ